MIAKDNAVERFEAALYRMQCQSCQHELEWTAQFDADGTDYVAVCCNLSYRLRPESVRVSVEEREGV